jgi:nucleoid DNA-binding protein
VNHTQRVAHVARQRRSLTKAAVRESVERYLETLAEEIASGEWVDIPYIGKIQVVRQEGKGYVTAITADGRRQRRKVQMRLQTKIRLYDKFKRRCRQAPID